MKKELIIAIVSIVVVLILLITLLLIPREKQISLAPPDLSIPTDCTQASIQTIWSEIFVEDSTGLTILTDTEELGKCNYYLAYKTNGNQAHILSGYDFNFNADIIMALAIQGEFSQEYIDYIESRDEENFPFISHEIENLTNYATLRDINNVADATDFYQSLYVVLPTALEQVDFQNYSTYMYNETEYNGENFTASLNIVVTDYSITQYQYLDVSFPNTECKPSWVVTNTSCTSNETYTLYYVDENECNSLTGKPDNDTEECDHDNNGIIGEESDIEDMNINVNLYINDERFDDNETYNTSETVELREGSTVRVSFNYDFSRPLNLDNIEIIKQSSSSNHGYLIVNGINERKTFRVDKLSSSSNSICILDERVDSKDDFTNSCNGPDETLVECQGSKSGFGCTPEGSYLVVSGLDHSAVKERIENITTPTCNPNWNCTDWPVACSSTNTQARVCTDDNNCNSTSGKPAETRNCQLPGGCIPEWECTTWSPEDCPKNETQVRTCTDSNTCNVNTDKPREDRTCVYKASNTKTIVIIIVALFGAIIIIIALVMIFKRVSRPKAPPYQPPSQIMLTPPSNRPPPNPMLRQPQRMQRRF